MPVETEHGSIPTPDDLIGGWGTRQLGRSGDTAVFGLDGHGMFPPCTGSFVSRSQLSRDRPCPWPVAPLSRVLRFLGIMPAPTRVAAALPRRTFNQCRSSRSSGPVVHAAYALRRAGAAGGARGEVA